MDYYCIMAGYAVLVHLDICDEVGSDARMIEYIYR
jgi:hypothetical protein